MLNLAQFRLVSAGWFHDQPDHGVDRIESADHLLIAVLGGRGRYRGRTTWRDATPGLLLVFPQGKPHAYQSDPNLPWDIVWMHVAGGVADTAIKALRPSGQIAQDLRLNADLIALWKDLALRDTARGQQVAPPDHARAWMLLGAIMEEIASPSAPDQSHPLEAVRAYVAEHFAMPLSVEDLAKAGHLSVRQLERRMKQEAGTGPMKYLAEVRMRRAELLLLQTRQPIHAIAMAVGYTDPLHFSRRFKQVTGQSPSDVRRGSSTS